MRDEVRGQIHRLMGDYALAYLAGNQKAIHASVERMLELVMHEQMYAPEYVAQRFEDVEEDDDG